LTNFKVSDEKYLVRGFRGSGSTLLIAIGIVLVLAL